MEIQKEISLSINETFVGKTLKVLIDSVEGEYFVGRSYRDAPEVDGEILISKENKKIKIGNFYDVVINAVSYTHLRAHETVLDLVCRLLLEKKKQNNLELTRNETR